MPISAGAVPKPAVLAVFFLSGFAALIYQLLWQRALFTLYGTTSESVTIVVAAFMMGLGLGSLAGGEVSKRPGRWRLVLFGGIEIAIGLYGLASLAIFRIVGDLTLGASLWQTGLISFAVVVVPTALMGSTLPLLVAYLVELRGHVGQAVSALYFVNTLGSAVACFLGALVVFGALGMAGSIRLAAAINIIIGAALLAWSARAGRTS